MCDSAHCQHDNYQPEERSIESDFQLHFMTALQAQAKGKKRQHRRHAVMALALAQRINMRNEVAKRLRDTENNMRLS